jgi:elongation factor G
MMAMADIGLVRNIGIVAHIDAGKTTLTEGILHRAGARHREGSVDGGDALTDWDETERKRGITIYSAAVSFPWRGHAVNLIDTPGHVDFGAEVERSMRVLDGAVVVIDAKEGAEAQSETVWRQADRHGVPRVCLVNKMDSVGADFAASVRSLRDRLAAKPAVLHMPLGEGPGFAAFVDLVRMVHVEYSADGAFWESPVPRGLAGRAAEARSALVEAVGDGDDAIAELYLRGADVGAAELAASIRAQTLAGAVHPVLCGSALRKVGVQHLLDAVCDFLPSPADAARDGLPADPAAGMVALAFNVEPDPAGGDLTYLRIYAGTLLPSTRVFNSTQGVKENVTRLYRMQAHRREPLAEARAGDIVAVVGPKRTVTGDTLSPKGSGIVLESPRFPEPVVTMSIEPQSSSGREGLEEALRVAARQDPTFRHGRDPETGETVMSGMGELHLEIVLERLRKCVPCSAGRPHVAYRETVTKASGAVEYRHVKQTGGRGQKAVVVLQVGPAKEDFLFRDETRGGAVQPKHAAAVERACREDARGGPVGGYPLTGIEVVLLDGEEHEVDSSELAFGVAAREAFRLAVSRARPILLEPVMRLSLSVPEDSFGRVSADIASRGGSIVSSDMSGGRRLVTAGVPLARMFGYASDIRSLTAGRASWSMEPERYEPVPAQRMPEG